jgi:Tfp pilus assembly protein PilF
LGPGTLKDLEWRVQIAAAALRNNPKDSWASTIFGAALYRAGRFDEAIQRLSEAAAIGPTVYSPAYTWFFLAMAHHRLGHGEEARQWLDKAVKHMEEETSNKDLLWNRRLTLHVLRREAEEMMTNQEEKNHHKDTKDTKEKLSN